MKPLYFVWNVEHGKYSGTRRFRMPALLDTLLCAARLLVIPRKAFSHGQGISRPIGIIYLRPLVGSLSAIVAAILLYASNHADAQSQAPMIGIMYLEEADGMGDPIHNWSRDPAVTNPYVQGIALRTHWNRVEPHEHADAMTTLEMKQVSVFSERKVLQARILKLQRPERM